MLDVDASAVGQHGDGLALLHRGELQAIVVHGVYRRDTMAGAVERLARHDPPFLQTSFPRPFRSWFYGRNINLSDPQLSGYFEQAAVFDRQLETLIGGEPPLADRIGALLSVLDGGRPVCAAPGPRAGEHYMPMTIRAHEPGGFIPAHFDNEVRLRPSYRHLARTVDPHILSFVLTFDAGEDGGALEVFALTCEPHDARLLSDDHVLNRPDIGKLDAVRFRLEPGDMIVLDSGRWLHRVTPVLGARTRWTACGFMACARDGLARLCWG